MLKNASHKANFSAADAAHHAPFTKISFATQQDSATTADATALTLSNIVLCSVGEAEGWGINIDAQFVADMVKDIKANMKKGVKSNLRHNHENAGFQLGRITNVRADGDRVIGDLKCYASADKSPLAPGMATWLIELVAEDPEAMMMSIVCKVAYYFQRDENGNEVKVWQYNADDIWISPNYDMPIYFAYGGIESCDAVADGALTEAMFSKPADNHTSLFTQLSNALKAALGLNKKGPGDDDEDTDFFPNAPSVQAAANNKIDMTQEEFDAKAAEITAQFSTKVTELEGEKTSLTASVAQAGSQLEAATARLTELATERDTLTAAVAERDTTIATLTAEVALLKDKPADEHAGGETDTTITASKGYGKHHEALKAELGLN